MEKAVKRIPVHCVEIEDKPGSLQKLRAQSNLSGVDFLCLSAFSCGENRGQAFVSAKDPKVFGAFAKEAGLDVTKAAGFLLDGEDHPGAAAEVLTGLAESDISGLCGSAMVFGGKYQLFVVVDTKNADQAEKLLGG